MNASRETLETFDVRDRGRSIILGGLSFVGEILGDARENIVDVRGVDLRVDVDGVGVEERRIMQRRNNRLRKVRRERVLVRRLITSNFR
jgi:hypothetical protein